MSDIKMATETFRDFGSLMQTLMSRPNNEIMKGEKSSQRLESEDDDDPWFGTKDFLTAVEMLGTGYKGAMDSMKRNLEVQAKLNSEFAKSIEHPKPHNAVVGFIPCVPNAIRNLPNSMVSYDRKPMKRKTVSIKYIYTGSCQMDTEWFIKPGTALLSAIDLAERNGITTELNLGFFGGEQDDEYAIGFVKLKSYNERYSLQKVSFPIAHPSMFRRIGFKWLETTPAITQNFSFGYGHPISHSQLEKNIPRSPGEFILTPQWINEHDCNVQEILRKIEVLK